jgi:hypothetical protein
LINFLLELRERARLPPTKARAEIAQPAEEVVGAHLGNRIADQGLDLLALREALDRAWSPPHPRQINAGEMAIVVGIDVAESQAQFAEAAFWLHA